MRGWRGLGPVASLWCGGPVPLPGCPFAISPRIETLTESHTRNLPAAAAIAKPRSGGQESVPARRRTGKCPHLKETFDNLDKFCLKLNPTKCSFGVPAGELLGFLVSARGIEANPEKIQAIVTMRKPTKLKEIQQLTGRVAALSRFVARLGEKALPFYALIKQGEKFQWNEEADRAFENLKRAISTPPILVALKRKNLSSYTLQPHLKWLARFW
ncbi:hypothetical protein QYE76_011587 [Lolium multiflorum]|uniref:Uncharacterized protein n=1 Tax=Lolium multiflorum TaxID=4521 RepID=A0AAD8TZG4_LOLMU|nr:hypothetical protein QYE76_011587 [Lolium multiflorum]